MFGQSKPVLFEPYGRRRSRWRVPRWLVLLSTGIAIGAAGLYIVQERYMPPRLSASETVALRAAFERTEKERARLEGELGGVRKQLDTAQADRRQLTTQLAESRAESARLQEDVASVVAALPPDPRGGRVEVRAGRFAASGGMLAYDVVLTRERSADKPISGVLQLVVAGESARGSETTAALKPVALSIGRHQIVRGSLPLPEGFKPRQTTIQVLDRPAGKALGMRVIRID
jgi:hypothetical protein